MRSEGSRKLARGIRVPQWVHNKPHSADVYGLPLILGGWEKRFTAFDGTVLPLLPLALAEMRSSGYHLPLKSHRV